MTTVGIYTRLSKDPEGTETATKRQNSACQDYAERMGWVVGTFYRDSDLSGYKKNVVRPDYDRMIRDLAGGSIDLVLCWRSDRFTRDPECLEKFFNLGDRAVLRSVTEPFDDSAMGRYMLRNFVNQHNFESAVKSERLIEKHKELAEAGKPTGGRRPYGYGCGPKCTDDCRKACQVIVPAEAAVIRELADRILAGESLRGCALDLNNRGVTTVTGKQWVAQTVKGMLLRPGLAGLRVYKGDVIGQADWDPILTETMHKQLVDHLSTPSRHHPGGGSARKYALAGFVFCGKCGSRLVSQIRNDRMPGFRCPPRVGCGGIRVNMQQVEDSAKAELLVALLSPNFRTRLAAIEGDVDADEAVSQKEQLDALDHQREKLIRWGREDLITEDELRVQMTELKEQRERLARRLSTLIVTIDAAVLPDVRTEDEFVVWWDKATLDERRSLLGMLLKRIDILPAKHGGAKFDWDRIKITSRLKPLVPVAASSPRSSKRRSRPS